MADASTSDMTLAVARVLHGTRAEGPHLRSAVWVQGCSIRCPGCVNPHLFEPGGSQAVPAVLAAEVLTAGVEGLTLLGGEPFDQADGCAELAERVRTAGIGVITFTGYEHQVLRSGLKPWKRLLDATDLLVDGPYRHQLPEADRGLVGSRNQRFVHLTERYRSFEPLTHPNRLDVRISPSGDTGIAGFLTRSQLKELRWGLT